jgi:guanylate kinase
MSPLPDFIRPLVVSGPSGVGKGTLIKRLFADFPDKFGFSVSHTTRPPRAGESDGREYHFVTTQTFTDLRANGDFIESAEFSGNLYGTSKQAVRDVAQTGRRCILDIEAQGIRQVKTTDLKPVYLFISPPSMSALRARLRGRGSDAESAIQKRLAICLKEIEYAKEPNVHDIVIINDDLDIAYESFKKVALGERITGDVLPPLDD